MSANTHHTPALKHHFEDLGQQHACERLGIWMFLATEILFFGGIFGAYTVYRLWYPHEFVLASSHLNRTIATVNTVFLILSSLTMTFAIRSAKLGDRGGLMRYLLVTAALETTLSEQPYVAGAAPGYADYIVFSVLQYARLGCPEEFLGEGTALRRWRDGLVRAFDGLGDRYPGYPAAG